MSYTLVLHHFTTKNLPCLFVTSGLHHHLVGRLQLYLRHAGGVVVCVATFSLGNPKWKMVTSWRFPWDAPGLVNCHKKLQKTMENHHAI
jgi:hypothetical protein